MRTAKFILFALTVLISATSAKAAILITVDKSTQQMTVDVDGVRRWTWPVSTGLPGHDTPSGNYTAFRMEADHYSKEWDDAPMPHSVFFTMRGHAIHGSYSGHIGRPASHGCVRLAPDNAAKLYALVEEEGLPNTKVVLTGDVNIAMARRGGAAKQRSAGAGRPAGQNAQRAAYPRAAADSYYPGTYGQAYRTYYGYGR
jgi:lipoprotein-anchoring transpeptidase ErfK/SrfK